MIFLNAAEWPNFTILCDSHTLTLIEENFEILISKRLQNGLTLLCLFVIALPSPWLKKNFKYDFLKRCRMAQFYCFMC